MKMKLGTVAAVAVGFLCGVQQGKAETSLRRSYHLVAIDPVSFGVTFPNAKQVLSNLPEIPDIVVTPPLAPEGKNSIVVYDGVDRGARIRGTHLSVHVSTFAATGVSSEIVGILKEPLRLEMRDDQQNPSTITLPAGTIYLGNPGSASPGDFEFVQK